MAEFPDALIEKAARALFEASPADPFADWDNTDRGIREVYRREARAVLLAVAPAIEANALRAAADWLDDFRPFPGEETESLRERADQIAKEQS